MRRTRLRPRRIKPRRADLARMDEAYKKFVKGLQCCAWDMSPCFGPVDSHHAGLDKGMGLKPHDRSCIPLCRRHHDHLHSLTGPFADSPKESIRGWLAVAVGETQAAYAKRAA